MGCSACSVREVEKKEEGQFVRVSSTPDHCMHWVRAEASSQNSQWTRARAQAGRVGCHVMSRDGGDDGMRIDFIGVCYERYCRCRYWGFHGLHEMRSSGRFPSERYVVHEKYIPRCTERDLRRERVDPNVGVGVGGLVCSAGLLGCMHASVRRDSTSTFALTPLSCVCQCEKVHDCCGGAVSRTSHDRS